jgi:hypothetical protein
MPSTRILRTWRRQAQYVPDGFGLAIAAPARWRCSTPTLGPACPAARAMQGRWLYSLLRPQSGEQVRAPRLTGNQVRRVAVTATSDLSPPGDPEVAICGAESARAAGTCFRGSASQQSARSRRRQRRREHPGGHPVKAMAGTVRGQHPLAIANDQSGSELTVEGAARQAVRQSPSCSAPGCCCRPGYCRSGRPS